MKRPRRGSPRKQPILDAMMIWTAVEWYRRQNNGGRRRSVREATAWFSKITDPVDPNEPHQGRRPAETLRSLYKVALCERRKLSQEMLLVIDDELEWLCSQEPEIARKWARERCVSHAAAYRPPRKARKPKTA
jgi:hypothetical protein